jgi:hypothetical protein
MLLLFFRDPRAPAEPSVYEYEGDVVSMSLAKAK